jgi:hypothetical protein
MQRNGNKTSRSAKAQDGSRFLQENKGLSVGKSRERIILRGGECGKSISYSEGIHEGQVTAKKYPAGQQW